MKSLVKNSGLLLIIVLLFGACMGGRIPCPEIETVKLRNYKPSSSSLSAKVYKESEEESTRSKEGKPTNAHFIQNISVEEWDCPKPGAKRYMPKSVKENIRNNRKRMESDMKKNQHQADSLSNR
jgi:hypothetical protein